MEKLVCEKNQNVDCLLHFLPDKIKVENFDDNSGTAVKIQLQQQITIAEKEKEKEKNNACFYTANNEVGCKVKDLESESSKKFINLKSVLELCGNDEIKSDFKLFEGENLNLWFSRDLFDAVRGQDGNLNLMNYYAREATNLLFLKQDNIFRV